jgi:hypothetical protein
MEGQSVGWTEIEVGQFAGPTAHGTNQGWWRLLRRSIFLYFRAFEQRTVDEELSHSVSRGPPLEGGVVVLIVPIQALFRILGLF